LYILKYCMKRNTPLFPSPQSAETATAGDMASEVVIALDRIFDCLIAVAPVEDACTELPLTLAEVRATKVLPMTGGVSMRSLADALGLALPKATYMVDRLVEKGVAVRIRPGYDRRVVLVALSEEAKAHRATMFRSRVGLIERIVEPLGPVVREQVVQVLNQIAQAAVSQATSMRGSS
jgi:DNA-binding MarR family transcriptional regulator